MKTIRNDFRKLAMAILALPMGFSLLTSCSEDENGMPSATKEVTFTTHINQAPVARNGSAKAYTPSDGQLSLFYGALDANAPVAHYTYDAETTRWNSSEPLFWQDLKAESASPKYTFYAVAPSVPEAFEGAVAKEQTTEAVFTEADLLAARTTADAIGTLDITLNHMFSQILVNVHTAEDDTKLSADELASTMVTLNGLKTGYALSAGTDGLVATVAGDALTGLKALKDGTSFRFIAPVQSLEAEALTMEFSVIIDEVARTFIYKAPKLDLLASTIKQFDITLNRTGVQMGSITVNEWTTSGETVSAMVSIAVGGAADTESEESPLDGVKLWTGEGEMTDGAAPSDARDYAYADGTWSSGNPFFVDDADGNSFYAMTDNSEADAVTGLTDLVAAGPTTMDGMTLSFDFKHLMALLTIDLVAGEGFTPSLEEAQIKTPMMSPDYTLSYDEEDKSVVLSAAGEPVSYDFVPGTAHVIVPQTLEAGSKLVVTLKNGKQYTAILAEALELVAGTSNKITLTINPTDVLVNVSVAEWRTGVDAEADALSIATEGTHGTVEGITALSVWNTKDQGVVNNYTHDGTNWHSSHPFYADNYAATDLFFVRHTPADEAADATTGVKDVLGNTTGVGIQNGGIAVTLEHLMAKLTVALAKDETLSSTVSLDGAKIALLGVLSEYSLSDANVATATAESGKDLELKAATDYILVPQTLAAGTELTITLSNGNKYLATLSEGMELKAGTANKIILTLTALKAVAIDLSVKEWATGATAEETLTLAVTGTAETPEGSEPTFTEFTIEVADAPIISNTGENGAPFGTQYYYEKLDDGSWTSTNPIYLDGLTATSTLYGFVMPTDVDGQPIVDNVTYLPDLLGTDAVSVKGGTAAFNFRHLYAQLTVKLVAGTGFTPSLDGAAIATPAMISTANIGTDADGNTLAVATDATDTYTIASDATHIVVPQTLTANSVFTVTFANGNTYTAALAEDVALEAGKNTTITLTLTPTAAAVKATVTDWGTAAAAAEVKLADVTAGDVSVTAAEGDKLTITYAPNNLTATYTYANSAWESTAPLYWDNIAKDGFSGEFSVEYVFATKTAPVEDKLVGTITGATYGSALSLNLAHTTAKMTFTFKGDGTTTTDDEVAAFAKTITLGDDTYTITDGAMHFAPRTLGDNDIITLTRANGNKYTVMISDFIDGGKVEAGKHYTITLTVSDTSVGISADIADWTTVTGSGEMKPEF